MFQPLEASTKSITSSSIAQTFRKPSTNKFVPSSSNYISTSASKSKTTSEHQPNQTNSSFKNASKYENPTSFTKHIPKSFKSTSNAKPIVSSTLGYSSAKYSTPQLHHPQQSKTTLAKSSTVNVT